MMGSLKNENLVLGIKMEVEFETVKVQTDVAYIRYLSVLGNLLLAS